MTLIGISPASSEATLTVKENSWILGHRILLDTGR